MTTRGAHEPGVTDRAVCNHESTLNKLTIRFLGPWLNAKYGKCQSRVMQLRAYRIVVARGWVALLASGVAFGVACNDEEKAGGPDCHLFDGYFGCACTAGDRATTSHVECSPESLAAQGDDVVCCADEEYPGNGDCSCTPIGCVRTKGECICGDLDNEHNTLEVTKECTLLPGETCVHLTGGCTCGSYGKTSTELQTCLISEVTDRSKFCGDGQHLVTSCNPPPPSREPDGGAGGENGGTGGTKGTGSAGACSSSADCAGKPCEAPLLLPSASKTCTDRCTQDDDCNHLLNSTGFLPVPLSANAMFGDPVTNAWGASTLSQGVACIDGACRFACPEHAAASIQNGLATQCKCLPNFRVGRDGATCEWDPSVECSLLSYLPQAQLQKLGISNVPGKCTACNSSFSKSSGISCHTGIYGCDFTNPARFEGECAEIVTQAADDACIAAAKNFTCTCDSSCIEDCTQSGCEDLCCTCDSTSTAWKQPACP